VPKVRVLAPLVPRLKRIVPYLPKITEDFYRSPEWHRLMGQIRKQRGNRCEVCGLQGGRPGDDGKPVRILGDHIVERKDGGAELDPANVMLLCLPCHNRKTAREKARREATRRT
jgi:5-methylcytosine-specific restriction protein A